MNNLTQVTQIHFIGLVRTQLFGFCVQVGVNCKGKLILLWKYLEFSCDISCCPRPSSLVCRCLCLCEDFPFRRGCEGNPPVLAGRHTDGPPSRDCNPIHLLYYTNVVRNQDAPAGAERLVPSRPGCCVSMRIFWRRGAAGMMIECEVYCQGKG